MSETREEKIYKYQRTLRQSMLDQKRTITHGPARSLASQLLLYLDDMTACWSIGTEWLRISLETERVDGGYAIPLPISEEHRTRSKAGGPPLERPCG